MSVVNCASISQAGSSFTRQVSDDGLKPQTISPDVSWSEINQSLLSGWERLKLMAESLINNNIRIPYTISIPQSNSPSDPAYEKFKNHPTEASSETDLNQFKKLHQGESENQTQPARNSSISGQSATSVDDVSNNSCEESNCFPWKILKIVGTAVGGGFLIGLVSPILFYFIITLIGCICYGKLTSTNSNLLYNFSILLFSSRYCIPSPSCYIQ